MSQPLPEHRSAELAQARPSLGIEARKRARLVALAAWSRRYLFGSLAATATIAYVAAFPSDAPSWNWFFGKTWVRNMSPGMFLAASFAAIPLAFRYVRRQGRIAPRLGVLVLVGAATQIAYVLAESNGTAGLRTVLHETNAHREFLNIALDQETTGLIGRYERLIPERRWVFPRSKPPGALLAYKGVVRLSKTVVGRHLATWVFPEPPLIDTVARRHWRADGTMLFLLPLLTFLTVVPLFFAARQLAGAAAAWVTVLLYTFAPSVQLVLLYLDGALYPLIGCTAAFLALVGLARTGLPRVALLFAAGLVISAGAFVSFSLLPVVTLVGVLPALHAASEDSGAWLRRLGRLTVCLLAYAAGLAAVHGWAMLQGYDPVARYKDALAFHQQWWSGGGKDWTIGSPLLFAIWLGAPCSLAVASEAIRSGWGVARALARRDRARLFPLYALTCTGLLAVTNAFSHARIESQRLWLFWVPFLAIVAAVPIARHESTTGRNLCGAIIAMQLATAFALKMSFSFF